MSNQSKSILKKLLGEGGAFLSKEHASGGATDETLYGVLKSIVSGLKNRILNGLLVVAPTTASTQATGATGNLTVRANLGAGVLVVGGVKKEFAAQADFVVVGAAPSVIPNGSALVLPLVAYLSSAGVPTINALTGNLAALAPNVTVGTTGPAATDAQIQAIVDANSGKAGLPWIRLADITFARTGDVNTFTQTADNSKADYGDNLVTVE